MAIIVSAGAAEYVTLTFAEINGADISEDPIEVSLGDYENPGTVWITPGEVGSADLSVRVVRLLIDDAVLPGSYYAWGRIADVPETVVGRCENIIRVR